MTMQFGVSVTGGQVGGALADDPEELWYALREIADIGNDDVEQVAEYAHGHEAEIVTKFLRKLADAIEGEAKAAA